MTKRISCLMMLVAALAIFLPNISRAEYDGNSRHGFTIGLGAGGGILNIRGGGTNNTKGSFLGDIKIGYGLNDTMLILYNGSYQYTKINGVSLSVYTVPVALQWFVYNDWYIRPGVGITWASASVTAGGVTLTANTSASLGLDFATGYEFRMGKSFALSPEAVYHYSHLRAAGANGHINSFGAQVSALWYF